MMKPTISLLLLASCATMYNRVIGVSDNDAKTAIAHKDYPKLQKLCTGDINTPDSNTRDDTCHAAYDLALERHDQAWMRPLCHRTGESFGGRFYRACEASLRLAAADNDMASMHELCDRDKYDSACRVIGEVEGFGGVAHADCTRLGATFLDAQKTYLKGATADEDAAVVTALARCDRGDLIFEHVAHIGSERGAEAYGASVLLAAAKRDDAALFAAFQSYVKTHAGHALFGAEFQTFAANHVSAWLVAAKHLDQCDALLAASHGATSGARYGLVDYYVAADCTAAAPQLVQLLSDEGGNVREDACIALGELGTPEQLPQVKILAETDRTNRVVERPEGSGVFVKDYFVADACSKAAGQITLRGGSSAHHGRG